MAVQAVSGVIGIGVAVLLFVILGNPSADRAYRSWLIPPLWRAIGPWLPPVAGTSAIRGIVYFDGAKVLGPSMVLLAYALVDAVALVVVATPRKSAQLHQAQT